MTHNPDLRMAGAESLVSGYVVHTGQWSCRMATFVFVRAEVAESVMSSLRIIEHFGVFEYLRTSRLWYYQ